MSTPAMHGKVPEPTPRAVQPMPASMLETTIAVPNAAVRTAVAASRLRCETTRSAAGDPALLGADLARALEILRDQLLQVRAGHEGLRLLRAFDVLLPLRRGFHLAHQLDVVRRLVGLHLARQPHRARLLVERDVEARVLAGRDVRPAGRGRHLAAREAMRIEDAHRALRARLPLADALARVVGVRVDVAARELRRRLAATLVWNERRLHVRHLLDEV